MFDAIVIGGGPAGLSAATWLSRYRKKVLVLDAGEHRNRWVEKAHGYLGSDPLAPKSFLEDARRQLGAYTETEIRPVQASAAGRRDDGVFTVEADGATWEARRLVLAVGVEDDFPEVENFFEHYGTSVFHCPTCDGYEAKGCDVVALGWSADLTGFALTLLGWAKTVTVVTDGRRFEGDEEDRRRLNCKGVSILEDDAVEFIGVRGRLEGVRLAEEGVVDCQLAFFSIAHHPRTALASQLGCALTDEGCIEVDLEGATTVPGVYAAGDVTPGLQLVQVAAAKGAIAGVACAQSLQGKDDAMSDDDTQTEGSETEGSETQDTETQDTETQATETQDTETDDTETEAETAEPEEPEDSQDPGERLEALGAEIQQVRQQLDDPLDGGDRSFVEKGEEEPVDDTIAPPG